MKETLFKLLFPSKRREIADWKAASENLKEDIFAASEENRRLKVLPAATLADIMRENLALLPHNFLARDSAGNALNPFEGLSEKELEVRVHELNTVYHNRAFGELLEFLTNAQLHYTMERATDDAQLYAGRFNINGLALVKANLNRYHNIYEESAAPPDSYDEYEIINE